MNVEIQRHNNTVLATLEPGDAVEFGIGTTGIGIYSHWALYIGDEKVIHLTGRNNDGMDHNCYSLLTPSGVQFDKAIVEEANFRDVAGTSKAIKNNSKDKRFRPSDVQEILMRARSKLGKTKYNVLWNNCEHFVSDCRYGKEISEQVETWIGVIFVIGGVVLGVIMAFKGRNMWRKM